MAQLYRFGRRIRLPSTIQILHELRAFSAQEDARQRHLTDAGVPETVAAIRIEDAGATTAVSSPGQGA
ncbi:MAG: hypothetical protein ACLPID_21225 [Beijerinckiaceae bacterium]